jgi:hypothetical protein
MILRDYFYLVAVGVLLLVAGSLMGLLFLIEHLTGRSIITIPANR